MFQRRGWSALLKVLQCDQTTVWAAPRMMCREEVRQSFQGLVRFVLRGRLQLGNNLDCFTGAFSARRRGLGIFALAALTRLPNRRVHVLFDPICGCLEGDRLRTRYGSSLLIAQRRTAS
jgi:hypothetical protein